MGTFVQFGAGNIGRSFIGRKFSDAGYDVVFVDIEQDLISMLNDRGSYPVVVKESGRPDQFHVVKNVRAIDGRDSEKVIQALVSADYAATSVGMRGLDPVISSIAKGLKERKEKLRPPLDLIIAENMRNSGNYFRKRLVEILSDEFFVEDHIGLIETSIGKMVPIMPRESLEEDPLQIFSEEYDQLIVDKNGFVGKLPAIEGLYPVEDICAYVDRKLFMHNMSHAATAYLAHMQDSRINFIWEAMELPVVTNSVKEALEQSAHALAYAYPRAFSVESLSLHSNDLLNRYKNKALGDTIFRVGRDLRRKLSVNDRMVGACLLAAKSGLKFSAIAKAACAALNFYPKDETGVADPRDVAFLSEVKSRRGLNSISFATGLRESDNIEYKVLSSIYAISC